MRRVTLTLKQQLYFGRKDMTETKKKTKKSVANLIVDIFLWIFLAFSLLMTVFAFVSNAGGKEYPVINGKCWLCVQSNSMAEKGGFYKGDLIIGKVLTNAEKDNLQVGDVITFYMDIDGDGNKELNSHRIIAINADGTFQTKGDHNELPDGASVSKSMIEAKWTGKRLSGIGSVIDFLRSSTGFLVCVVIPLACFFIYQIVMLVLTVSKVKGKKTKLSAEDEERIKELAIQEYIAKQQAEKNAAPDSDAPAE